MPGTARRSTSWTGSSSRGTRHTSRWGVSRSLSTVSYTHLDVYKRQERAPSAHPVAGAPALTAEDALSDFDGISYAKGATALRQLIAFVGDEVFVGGVSNYLRDKAFGNGTFAEFLAAIEASAGRDLGDWARDLSLIHI